MKTVMKKMVAAVIAMSAFCTPSVVCATEEQGEMENFISIVRNSTKYVSGRR